MKNNYALVILLLIGTAFPCQAKLLTSLSNEEGTTQIELHENDGALLYQITHTKPGEAPETVVEMSRLGLKCEESEFKRNLKVTRIGEIRTEAGKYTLICGKKKHVSYSFREQFVEAENQEGHPMQIILRAQADGVAFRYGFPKISEPSWKLSEEITTIKIPEAGRAWIQGYETVATWSPAYEMEYANGIAVGTPAPANSAGWAFPALFQTKSSWVLATEALLDGSCYAAHLERHCEQGEYRLRLPEDKETYGVAPRYAQIKGPWKSPWRVFVVGHTLATIVESTLVTDLNPDSQVGDPSWIKPGVASWSWWSDVSSASDYNRMIPWIDLAADMQWPYATVDLGWHQMKNGNIEQLIAYAKKRGVGLILWYNSGGRHNQVPDAGPKDRMDTPENCEKEFAWLAQIGAVGVKVDFFQSDKQYVIQKYLDILKAAAKHKIMVNFHGATIPRGWARTYPHLMTSEGVRGAEQYWDPGFAERAHTLSTIYTFTRNTVGSMDFTPVVIGGAPHLQWHKTTNAFEIATAIAFESGWQHICATPAALHTQPGFVWEFLRGLPTAWDETRLVAGSPGESSVLARRSGNTWYLAALNGSNEAQTIQINLSFLKEGLYKGICLSDGSWQKEIVYSELTARPGDSMNLVLAGRGGTSLRFDPLKN